MRLLNGCEQWGQNSMVLRGGCGENSRGMAPEGGGGCGGEGAWGEQGVCCNVVRGVVEKNDWLGGCRKMA